MSTTDLLLLLVICYIFFRMFNMKEKFASCDDEQDNEYLDKLFDSIEKNNNGTIKKKTELMSKIKITM